MSEEDAAVRAWIEAKFGPVTAFERQARWRPAWFADVASGQRFYIRGARTDIDNDTPLAKEAAVLNIFAAHAIPAPRVHGMIEAPEALVLTRLAGRANLGTVEDAGEKAAILGEYVDALARIHAIPVAEFEAQGFHKPPDAQALALVSFEGFVRRYRKYKRAPEPLMEFAIRWLRQNAPRHRYRPCFVHGDPAQFMFDQGRMSGVMDLELGHIGDVAHDLAGFRLRDFPEPLGDVGAALQRYEAVTGEPLDLDAIDFHTVQFSFSTPLSLIGVAHDVPALPQLTQYMEWRWQYALTGLEAMASMLRVGLAETRLPEPVVSRAAAFANVLPEVVRGLEAAGEVAEFRRMGAAKLAEYVRRLEAYGPAIEALELAETERLLGAKLTDWREADAKLEAFVLGAPPARDAELVAMFHARVMRQMLLLEPILGRTPEILHLQPLRQLLQRT